MSSPHVFGRILNERPLITISKRALSLGQPMGLAGLIENIDQAGPSLHLIGLSFTLEPTSEAPRWKGSTPDTAADIARDVDDFRRRHPNATAVFLANTEGDVLELSRVGVPCILANELIFTDERVFKVYDSQGPRRFTAVYNAALVAFKRHRLAADVDDLLLIFKQPQDPLGAIYPWLRRAAPTATWANVTDGGSWRGFSHESIAQLYGLCSVGLCLSAAEGAMRASMEYLLCGLPVVSTRSIGGRDRYFRAPYALIVEPRPQAIAAAVRQVAALNLPRAEVRRAVSDLLSFDRANFVRALNGIIQRELNVDYAFSSFEAFRGSPIHTAPLPSPDLVTSGSGARASADS